MTSGLEQRPDRLPNGRAYEDVQEHLLADRTRIVESIGGRSSDGRGITAAYVLRCEQARSREDLIEQFTRYTEPRNDEWPCKDALGTTAINTLPYPNGDGWYPLWLHMIIVADDLFYVGWTRDLDQRLTAHARSRPWRPSAKGLAAMMPTAVEEVQVCSSEADAREEERRLGRCYRDIGIESGNPFIDGRVDELRRDLLNSVGETPVPETLSEAIDRWFERATEKLKTMYPGETFREPIVRVLRDARRQIDGSDVLVALVAAPSDSFWTWLTNYLLEQLRAIYESHSDSFEEYLDFNRVRMYAHWA